MKLKHFSLFAAFPIISSNTFTTLTLSSFVSHNSSFRSMTTALSANELVEIVDEVIQYEIALINGDM